MTRPIDKIMGSEGPSQSEDLAALMAKYGEALRRYFVRKAGVGIADDLVQEVFLRLQISAEQRPLEDVERYIFTVARRVLLNRRRSDVRHDTNLHDSFDDVEHELLDDITPERTLAAKQEFERVLNAISNMPPRMQMAFVLHRFGRLSYSAIAKQMGIGKSAVQDLMERALDRISVDGEAP